jgi:hypothetical protein
VLRVPATSMTIRIVHDVLQVLDSCGFRHGVGLVFALGSGGVRCASIDWGENEWMGKSRF